MRWWRAALVALTLGTALGVPPAAGGSPVETLLQHGSLYCEPALRHFCGNIHIGCTGRSAVAASPFTVAVAGGEGRLDFAGGAAPVADLPLDGALTVPDDRGYLLVRLRPGFDYFRLEADGRYNLRIYHRGAALMSSGRCRPS
ncbi:MAG TPA: hypothetical protein VK862_04595 [Afifellaceae bacterium]|nr:hypothetical protein [Afifellaceae bacterium]